MLAVELERGVPAGMDAHLSDQMLKWFGRGEYGRIIYTCDQLLNNPAHAASRSDLLYWKGYGHMASGRAWYGEAMTCFREGIAAGGKDRVKKVRLMVPLGHMYNMIGDYPSFEQLMKEYRRVAKDRDPEVMRWGAVVVYNFGCTLENAFRRTEAEQAFAEAAAIAREFAPDFLGRCVHNLGGVQLTLGKFTEAAEHIAQVDTLMPDATFGHKMLSRKAEYHLATGDLISAQQYITQALVHPAVDDMTRADVYYTWAQTLVALKRPAEAQERALLGLEFAVKAVHYRGIHQLTRFLQQFGSQAQSS